MAVSEEILEQRRGIHIVRPGPPLRRLRRSPSMLGIAAVVGGLVAFHESLAGRILPGVSAAGVDLGGLTTDEARAALTARYGAAVRGRSAPADRSRHDDDPVQRGRSRRGHRRDAGRRDRARPRRDLARRDDRRDPSPPRAGDRSRSSSPTTTTAPPRPCRRSSIGWPCSPSTRRRRGPRTASSRSRRSTVEPVDGAAALAAVDAAMRDPATVAGAAVAAPSRPYRADADDRRRPITPGPPAQAMVARPQGRRPDRRPGRSTAAGSGRGSTSAGPTGLRPGRSTAP